MIKKIRLVNEIRKLYNELRDIRSWEGQLSKPYSFYPPHRPDGGIKETIKYINKYHVFPPTIDGVKYEISLTEKWIQHQYYLDKPYIWYVKSDLSNLKMIDEYNFYKTEEMIKKAQYVINNLNKLYKLYGLVCKYYNQPSQRFTNFIRLVKYKYMVFRYSMKLKRTVYEHYNI